MSPTNEPWGGLKEQIFNTRETAMLYKARSRTLKQWRATEFAEGSLADHVGTL